MLGMMFASMAFQLFQKSENLSAPTGTATGTATVLHNFNAQLGDAPYISIDTERERERKRENEIERAHG